MAKSPLVSERMVNVNPASGRTSPESPSLVPALTDDVPSSRFNPYLLTGAAVLGVGLVILFGGALFAQARRRRVSAASDSSLPDLPE